MLLLAFIATFGLSAVFKVQAASQTWTNAPVDATWTNVNNWVGLAVPGGLNLTGNTVNNDTATFNSPIFGTIGGASNPILTDDATVSGARSRQLGSIIFDTVNCGAFVFSNTSPADFSAAETGILNLSHNGSLTINAAVTNSQIFMVPLRIRLPSSTAGIYNFVNNATDPKVTLFMNTVTNDSANTRGTVFVLSGSNTGTNTANTLSKGTTTSGAMGLTKNGTGTWILPNANDLPAQSVNQVNDGTLIVKNEAAFGASSTVTVNSNGVLRVDGVTLTNTTGGVTILTVALNSGGTLRMNGNGTNNIRMATSVGASGTVSTTGSGDVLTVSTNSGGALDSILHVAGPGTVVLTQPSTYVGKWSLDAGTTAVAAIAALGTGPLATIGAGATLDVSPLGAVSYSPGPAGLGGSGTGTTVGSTAATIKADVGGVVDLATGAKDIKLTYTPASFTGDLTHPALFVSQGTLSLGGNLVTINNNSGTPLGVGTYRLIQQASGSITSGGGYVADVTGSGLIGGTLGTIQVSGGNVDLVVFAYTSKNLVWKGGNPNSTWNNGLTANWLDGVTPSVFNSSDFVVFNATGSPNTNVNLSGTLLPSSVTVDTSAANYTFSGSGVMAGAGSLAKISTGTLVLQNVNTYTGGTVVSNGTLRVGINNAIPGIGAGTVSVISPGVLDLNTFSDSIGGLNGDGTINNAGGGASTLTIGNNNGSGTFLGTIQNTSGTLGLTKEGTGVQTILGANTYTGPTYINNGTLRAGNLNALSSSVLIITNIGVLDARSTLVIPTLSGYRGTTIANNSSATTNILIFNGSSTNIGAIVDGSGGGAIGVLLKSGSLQLDGPNTYSGGTILSSGTTLSIGSINSAPTSSGNAGTGSIVASNSTTIHLSSTVSTSSQLGSPITTVDNATVLLTGGQVADQFNGQFMGSATATNIYGGNMSIGGSLTFSNFLGTAIFTNISPNAVRFNATLAGGENTTFVFNGGGVQTRDATTVVLGALVGVGGIYGPSVTAGATYIIGGKGLDTTYSGSIGGANSIVKSGTGRLTLNGGTTNDIVFDAEFNLVTNVYFANSLSYLNGTTISNGVLKLSAPANITSSSVITLAGTGAVLDASSMGYGVNQLNENGVLTNKFLVTNGVFEVISGQTLAGFGTIRAASVVLDAGSILNVGLPYGTLTATNTIQLGGAINMYVNATNAPNASKLQAQSFIVDGTASLIVTNYGGEYAATFQLFNQAVSIPHTLPTLTGTNLWVDNLAVDGSITLVAPTFVPPVNTTPTNITTTVSGGNLTLAWPADHTGWRLQTQTNTLAVGLNTNWVDVAGATTTNQVVVPINSINGSVFFRMVYP